MRTKQRMYVCMYVCALSIVLGAPTEQPARIEGTQYYYFKYIHASALAWESTPVNESPVTVTVTVTVHKYCIKIMIAAICTYEPGQKDHTCHVFREYSDSDDEV
jgi:hypothetical protein